MIEFKVEDNALKSIEQKLGDLSSKAPTVMKKAVNETAKQARKQLASEAQKKYAVKSGSFNKAMKIKNATVRKPEAIITATGQVQELRDFKVSTNRYATGADRPNLTKGKVLKNGSLKPLEVGGVKAFITKFRSGHVAVVQRVPGKKMKSNPKKEFIKKLLSPSIPTMIGNEEKVYGIVEPDIAENLKANINKHIQALLEG